MTDNKKPHDESFEKTSIVSGETFSGNLKQAEQTPPALIMLMGPASYMGKQWLLSNPEYIIGRSPESSIFIDDRSVSRSHARLMVVGSDVTIQDLGSSNKTAINNEVLDPSVLHKLENNDQVRCGNIVIKFLEKGNLEAIANRQLSEKAERDSLTGAYNKGALIERGPEVLKRAEVLNEELSILVFDIDFFKKINDTHGHPGGDHILRELGRIVSHKLVRTQDFFARYGGEEFVLILSGAPEKNAMEVAERVRATIEGNPFAFDGKSVPVTISIGVATRHGEVSWDALFERADKALYQSKQNGRNRVTLSP